jgi:hypothetical protein
MKEGNLIEDDKNHQRLNGKRLISWCVMISLKGRETHSEKKLSIRGRIFKDRLKESFSFGSFQSRKIWSTRANNFFLIFSSRKRKVSKLDFQTEFLVFTLRLQSK